MDAAEYKHVVLGLIFLKYISDAFEEQHAKLEAERGQGADPEDPDEYRGAEHPVFWVPPEARWLHLKAQAKQATIGQLVDDAMGGIERDDPAQQAFDPLIDRYAINPFCPRLIQFFPSTSRMKRQDLPGRSLADDQG